METQLMKQKLRHLIQDCKDELTSELDPSTEGTSTGRPEIRSLDSGLQDNESPDGQWKESWPTDVKSDGRELRDGDIYWAGDIVAPNLAQRIKLQIGDERSFPKIMSFAKASIAAQNLANVVSQDVYDEHVHGTNMIAAAAFARNVGREASQSMMSDYASTAAMIENADCMLTKSLQLDDMAIGILRDVWDVTDLPNATEVEALEGMCGSSPRQLLGWFIHRSSLLQRNTADADICRLEEASSPPFIQMGMLEWDNKLAKIQPPHELRDLVWDNPFVCCYQ